MSQRQIATVLNSNAYSIVIGVMIIKFSLIFIEKRVSTLSICYRNQQKLPLKSIWSFIQLKFKHYLKQLCVNVVSFFKLSYVDTHLFAKFTVFF